MLTKAEYDRFSAAEELNEQDRWNALYRLHDRLDDQFIVVGETGTDDRSPATPVVCLGVFSARNKDRTPLYAAVSRAGVVTVGRIYDPADRTASDLAGPKAKRRFTFFDPLTNEVVALASTERFRVWGGDRLDLFVVVRSNEETAQVSAYHGIVWVDSEGNPRLEPASDDGGPAEDSTGWFPVDASGIPVWLTRERIAYAWGIDPFDVAIGKRLQGLDDPALGSVAVGAELMARATGDTLVLYEGTTQKATLLLREHVHALALPGRSVEGPRVVIGYDDRSLSVSLSVGKYRRTWTEFPFIAGPDQPLPDLPMAIALLDGREKDTLEILVGLYSGQVLHLRGVPPGDMRRLWDGLWSALELNDPDKRIQAARARVGKTEFSEDEQLTALVGAIDAVLAVAPGVGQAGQWIKAVAGLFAKVLSQPVLTAGVERLAEALQRALADRNANCGPAEVRGAPGFVFHLVLEVYQLSIPMVARERLDATVRLLEAQYDLQGDAALSALAQRARETRKWLWKQRLLPSRDLEDENFVEWTSLGISRWPSAYVPVDTLGPGTGSESWVPVLGYLRCAEKVWLAVGRRKVLSLHAIDDEGRVWPRADLSWDAPSAIHGLMRLPRAGSDRLLVVEQRGAVTLLGDEDGKGLSLRPFARLDEVKDGGVVAAIARSDLDLGHSTLAVVRRVGRQSRLDLYEASQNGINALKSDQDLGLVGVSCVELGRHAEGGYWLFVATDHAGPVYRYRVQTDGTLSLSGAPLIRRLAAVSVLLLDSTSNPNYLLIGDQAGLLSCLGLSPGGPSHLAWTYEINGAIRAAARDQEDGGAVPQRENHFLVATEAGELCLLRACDGRRPWASRVPQPVRRLITLRGEAVPLAILGLGGGAIATFVHLSHAERQAAYEAGKEYLRWLKAPPPNQPEEKSPWRLPDADGARAFHALWRGERPAEVVARHARNRETSARIIRHVTEQDLKLSEEERTKLLAHLSFRTIKLLLYYLDGRPVEPAQFPFWRDAIYQALKARKVSQTLGDDSFEAAKAAWIAFLRQIGLHTRTVADLMSYRPPDEFFKDRSVGIEFLRIFAREASQSKTPSGRLLPALFEHLLDLPPVLFMRTESIFIPGGEADLDWIALSATLRGHGEPQHFERLAGALGDPPERGQWLPICCHLLELLRLCGPKFTRLEHWLEWRREGLAVLRTLYAGLFAYQGHRSRRERFVAALRERVGPNLPPEDADRLHVRRTWFEEAHAWIKGYAVDSAETPWGAWEKQVPGFLSHIQALLLRLCEREVEYLQSLIRPFLRLQDAGVRPAQDRRVVLPLRLEPEGDRVLFEVRITLDATGPEGLEGSGQKREALDFVRYPADYADRDLLLSGYARPGQRHVEIRVSLSAGGSERHTEAWSFPIRWEVSDRRVEPFIGEPSWIEWLGQRFRVLIQEASGAVIWLVFDTRLGQAEVLGGWDAQYTHSRLDVDNALHAPGVGHLPPLRRVIEQIEKRLKDPRFATPKGRPVLVLGPTDELLRDLTDERHAADLAEWLDYLASYAKGNPRVRLVVLVSSAHAALVRRHAMHAMREVPMHLELQRSLLVSGTVSPALTEVRKLVAKHLSEQQAAYLERVVARLGGDLRLIAEWMRWAKRKEGPADLERFCREDAFLKLLAAELASLPALDFLLVFAGATTKLRVERQRVRAGHVAAEDYFSTVQRHQPKHLQRAGIPFKADALHQIGSDSAPPDFLRLEGFGVTGTPYESVAPVMKVVSSLRDRASRLERLAGIGFGEWISGVFRTGSPYRERLLALSDQYRGHPLGQRINLIYQALVGPDRWLAEALGHGDIRGWKASELEALMPQARSTDVAALLRLSAAWREGAPDAEVESVLQTVFGEKHLRRSSEDWGGLRQDDGLVYRYHRDASSVPTDTIVWLPLGSTVTTERLSHAVRSAAEGSVPVIALGPGAERLVADPDRRVASLGFPDLREAACRGDLVKETLRKVRSQLNLTMLSPFQIAGALPPGSRLFKGREEERRYIQAHIRHQSIMIVGARTVGKTSLLNNVFHWATGEQDLFPIRVDLQGASSSEDFCNRLAANVRSDHPGLLAEAAEGKADAYVLLRDLAKAIGKLGRFPIFLFNEIDLLASKGPELVSTWRAINDEPLARFLLVGYAVVGELGDARSPFFRFTEGDRYGGRAFAPTTVTESAAREILQFLEEEPLSLRWRDREAERERGYQHLIEHSYCIPWVLQRYAILLVARLADRRRDTLTYDDVLAVTSEASGVVWNYFAQIEYDKLGHAGNKDALQRAFELVLFAIARRQYFLGGASAPIRDPKLRSRKALDLGFNVPEAYEIIQQTLADLVRGREEQDYYQRWFDKLDLPAVFRLLTLTLVLESDPDDAQRYRFLSHILPIELWRRYQGKDPTLDGLIVDLAVNFLRYSKKT